MFLGVNLTSGQCGHSKAFPLVSSEQVDFFVLGQTWGFHHRKLGVFSPLRPSFCILIPCLLCFALRDFARDCFL